MAELDQKVKILVLIYLVMLLDEVGKVILCVIVLLNVLEKTATLLLLSHASHGELEYVLAALFVIDFYLIH